MKNETRDDRLRRILREADPVQGDTELTAEESRAMRRAVLTAAPEPRRRFLSFPVLAGAAVAVIVILLVWGERVRTPIPPRQTTRATRTAPAPPQSPAIAPPVDRIAAKDAAPIPEMKQPRTVRRHRDRIAAATLAEPAPKTEDELRTRQVQFATPGGTRVIWILTSDKAL
jgi:hypothetical protein